MCYIMATQSSLMPYFLNEDKEVAKLLKVELDCRGGNDGVDVLYDCGGLARLEREQREKKREQ